MRAKNVPLQVWESAYSKKRLNKWLKNILRSFFVVIIYILRL